jgi:hypothetical protein
MSAAEVTLDEYEELLDTLWYKYQIDVLEHSPEEVATIAELMRKAAIFLKEV